MRILGIIPARLKSTRLPEKMLKKINGKPLIYYTWRQAKKVKLLDEVVVATDSEKIIKAVRKFGGETITTSSKNRTGTDCVAEAARKYKKFRPDIVINIQGDEPLISPDAITAAATLLIEDKKVPMGTIGIPMSKSDKEIANPNAVKVILANNGYAIYFSRSVIPYARNPHKKYWRHVGMYAYRYDMLQKFSRLPKTPLEKAESLEQLRLLESGFPIKVKIGNYTSVSVDTQADLKRVRKLLTH